MVKLIIVLAIVGVLIVIGGLLLPHLLQWFIGGAVGGAAMLGAAQKARKTGDKEHKKNIQKERREIDTLQDEANEAVEHAAARKTEDPNKDVEGLTTQERRDRLRQAAERLTGEKK